MTRALILPSIALAAGVAFAAAGWVHRPAASETARSIDTSGMAPADVYRTICGACHAAHHPRSFTRAQWATVVDEMQQRADHRGIQIQPAQQEVILRYLEENAR